MQPAGNLHCPYVVTLTVVGAALRDQDTVTVLQMFDLRRAFHSRLQKSLVARHEYRKRCERNALRHVFLYPGESLTVGDDNGRRSAQTLQSRGHTLRLCADRCTPGIQYIPDHLLLRKDQPAFGGSLVNGNDQNDLVSRCEKIRYQPGFPALLCFPCPINLPDCLLDLRDSLSGQGTGPDKSRSGRFDRFGRQRG